jgi:hypothetical protein
MFEQPIVEKSPWQQFQIVLENDGLFEKNMFERNMLEQPMFEKSRSQQFQIVLENDGLFEKNMFERVCSNRLLLKIAGITNFNCDTE